MVAGYAREEYKAKAVDSSQKEKVLEDERVGVDHRAPGFDEFNARLKTEYGYGVSQTWSPSIESRGAERDRPLLGTMLRPSDGDIPREVRVHTVRRLEGRALR